MQAEITKLINKALAGLGLGEANFTVEYPVLPEHGDYAVNVALVVAKERGVSPRELAEKLATKIREHNSGCFERVEVAGPGFLNFYLSDKFLSSKLTEIIKLGGEYGRGNKLAGQKIMVEYTDPNPFKEFHIGHLMSNAIGESVSRLVESQGAEVKRANWQGDVGLHIAKALWGKLDQPDLSWARAYAHGTTSGNETEIREINKKVYDRSDEQINQLYDEGRKWSLDYFETIYKRLGTKFDYYFFESEEGSEGKKIVEENLKQGIFEKSDGAVIFRGEKYGLHTRVFINSEGLPTYEAKELGLNKKKFELEPELRCSVIVTGNEITDYFKVLLKVTSLLFPLIAERTVHLPHGMLRLPTGKMSSRTGQVITAESLLDQVKAILPEQSEETRELVAVAALKYSILRQSPGRDIIFDLEKSISFEGDSGPYLQYTCVRAKSVVKKAGNKSDPSADILGEINLVSRLLVRFPEIVARAASEYAPNYLVTYLTELAGAFNSYYAENKIIGSPEEAYRLVLARATAQVLESGLILLAIRVPELM